MSKDLSLFLLSIRGALASPTLEAARKLHNSTAGAPANIAAAKSLGDVSHMVYVPLEAPKKGAGEFLILDIWNSMEGLNNFFANPTVQEQAGQIFTQRDPVVWTAAQGFDSYHIPAPFGMNYRYITTARAKVKSIDDARKLHNSAIANILSKARKAGNLSHESYFRMAAPGSPEAMEWFGLDVWIHPDEMMSYYEDADFLAGFNEMFTAEADTAVWVHPKGDWSEW
jgi:hypothetical protein